MRNGITHNQNYFAKSFTINLYHSNRSTPRNCSNTNGSSSDDAIKAKDPLPALAVALSLVLAVSPLPLVALAIFHLLALTVSLAPAASLLPLDFALAIALPFLILSILGLIHLERVESLYFFHPIPCKYS
ncbi:MAG: hypothetical protein LBF54_01590 [Holosporaceae bacterium]|jgi:hypothetical protein|nr:hypothetical protein [Holosporaceae bacterium]